MTISPSGVVRIKGYEGCRLTIYKDEAGLDTIGVGHLVLPGEDFSAGITTDRALELLTDDLSDADTIVNDAIKVVITQDQYDSLVSLCFNIGARAFRRSSVLAAVNSQLDRATIRERLCRWNRVTVAGVKQVSPRLDKRRRDEALAWA